MTKEELIAFEDDIAREFEAGKIHAPVHLSGGNEDNLIGYFANYVKPQDWLFCSWRSHFHCLLKGVPPADVKQAIMEGRSISLCFPEHKIFSSGIVGGTAPIALGVAQSLQWRERDAHNHRSTVHVFLGDMTAKAGIVRECMEYGVRRGLPIEWIVEKNGISICTPTEEAWGTVRKSFEWWGPYEYSYEMTRRHVGVDKWVKF